MKNILFISPHPDDELVGATFIIKKILLKKNLIIFFPTNGVLSKDEMWIWEKISNLILPFAIDNSHTF